MASNAAFFRVDETPESLSAFSCGKDQFKNVRRHYIGSILWVRVKLNCLYLCECELSMKKNKMASRMFGASLEDPNSINVLAPKPRVRPYASYSWENQKNEHI